MPAEISPNNGKFVVKSMSKIFHHDLFFSCKTKNFGASALIKYIIITKCLGEGYFFWRKFDTKDNEFNSKWI